jgi:hypothetical protein
LWLAAAAGLALYFAGHHEEPSFDWRSSYEPAARHLLAGESPYRVDHFFNPPWVVLAFVPFTLLGNAGFAAWLFASQVGLAVVARRLGGVWWTVPLVWLSPPVISLLRQGQLDWLVYLSVITPPWLGAFLVLIKPQVGIGLAALLTVRVWRRGGVVGALRIWLPPLLALAGSFMLWGNWVARATALPDDPLHVSIWPDGVPFGALALLLALRWNSVPLALVAAPLLSPYYNYFSLAGVPLAVVRYKWVMFLFVGLPWSIYMLRFVVHLVMS